MVNYKENLSTLGKSMSRKIVPFVCEICRWWLVEKKRQSVSIPAVTKVAKTLEHFQTINSMKWDVHNEPIDLKDYKLYFNKTLC